MSESLCLACANFDICKYAEQVVSNQEKMEDIILNVRQDELCRITAHVSQKGIFNDDY